MGFRLKRRTFLRGAGGIAIGLPTLECMLDNNGIAYAGGPTLPKRYALTFAGQSIGGDGYAKNENRLAGKNFVEEGHFIAPPETGTDFSITTPLEPLSELLNDIQVVSNLRIPFNATDSDAGAVPAGGAFRGFHGGGASPLLSGMRSTSTSFNVNGITSDQMIAADNAGATPFDSLVFRAQPSWYLSDSGFAGRQYLSYLGQGDRIEAQASPQIAYMSLFGSFTPDNAEDLAILDFTLRSRRSVLDLVTAKREAVLGRVGTADRARLERHFDELRDLEGRISAIDPGEGACAVPTDPGDDPPIGGDNAGSGSSDIAGNTGYSDEARRARTFADIIHMAFVCDLTRAATLQFTCFQTHMNVTVPTEEMGVPIRADLHEVAHNGDQDNRGQIAVSTLLKWHVGHHAYLVEKLRQTPEGAGTVLDNTVALFVPEGGHGQQLDDGVSENQAHSVDQMCMVVAGGRSGGLVPGKHIRTEQAHPAQVLISAMQAAGHEGETLGEVSGAIPELFA